MKNPTNHELRYKQIQEEFHDLHERQRKRKDWSKEQLEAKYFISRSSLNRILRMDLSWIKE